MPRSISYSVVGSTQEVATRLAREGAPHGTTVVAESQLLGRGREGRTWVSPKGGLYASVVVRPDPSAFPFLSLAVGRQLQALLSRYATRGQVRVRWPNDLMALSPDPGVPARKLGGVLTEVVVRHGVDAFAVVGVGINVEGRRSDFPPELQDHVAFLSELSDQPLSLKDLAGPVREAVLGACERVATDPGRQALPGELQGCLFGIGRTVALEGAVGTFKGVGPRGEALVQVEGEPAPRSLVSGELTLEER